MERTAVLDRLATAPISWGICEVPGWGLQLPIERVLSEMRDLGFPATELGSTGWLPIDPDELRSLLAGYELRLLAAFVPLVLHEPDQADRALAEAESMARLLEAVGAECFNTAPVTSWDWGPRQPLAADAWGHLVTMLDRIDEITSARGLTQVVHPHVGTVVETATEVERVLAGSGVAFVLDTAHLAVGGYDPVRFVADAGDRVGLVHLKDADLALAERLSVGELSLMEAVQSGIFPPVGDGDLDIDGVVGRLEASGYDGWYVIEQDVAITGPEPGIGSGPVEGVRQSVDYLRGLDQRLRV